MSCRHAMTSSPLVVSLQRTMPACFTTRPFSALASTLVQTTILQLTLAGSREPGKHNVLNARDLVKMTQLHMQLGVHKSGEKIVAKLLHKNVAGLVDQQFLNEAQNLMGIKHKNIVQLVGYCSDKRNEFVKDNGKHVFAERTYNVLCFEYMSNGSLLQEHISDEHVGLDWDTRYKIIKGTCEGLKYLHEGMECPVCHLDLNPGNISLDRKMVPKLMNFGFSRLSGGEEKTEMRTSCTRTIAYMPPEYLHGNIVSKKFDIFSLGVIVIEIMAGPTGNCGSAGLSYQQFVDLVHDNWRNRLQGQSPRLASLEACCQQVKTCIEIALGCVEYDPHKRPAIGDIVHMLNETEIMIGEVPSFSSDPGSSTDQISSVDELVEQLKSVAVSAPPDAPLSASGRVNQAKKAHKLQGVSRPKGPGETIYEASYHQIYQITREARRG